MIERGRGAFHWSQPEVSWPLSLFAGFGGTWIGLEVGFPGLAALLATLLVAPLIVVLLGHERGAAAAFACCAWAFGILIAPVAAVSEGSFAEIAPALPLAQRFVDTELGPLAAGVVDLEALAHDVGRNAVVLLVLLLLSWPTRGLATLLGLAVCLGAVGGGAAWFAEQAGSDRLEGPFVLGLAGMAPYAVLQALGVLVAALGIAQAPSPLPDSPAVRSRRNQILGGLTLLAAGLALHPWAAPWWGTWLGGWLG